MATIKQRIVCSCILFLAISWLGENLGASASILPLLNQGSLSSSCNYNGLSSASQNPISDTPLSVSLITVDNSAAQRQQLLDKATILLKELSSSTPVDSSVKIVTPCNQVIENQERILLQSLVDRLEAYKTNSLAVNNSSSSLPAIPEDTYNAIVNQYLEVRSLTLASLTPANAQIVQSALGDLYKTFVKIITGQLLNVELPNLCSKTLALNTQLKATNAPTALQDAVTGFIKSLTLALTGQSQVTISGLCDCLNDLETSIVTVVENDKSQRLQYLLSNLVDAVTSVVVSGGDVGCNVIDVVQRHVANIKQAVQEETNVRTGRIYGSVLNFEEELYKVLLASAPTVIASPLPIANTISSNPVTEEDYLTEIGELFETIFGDRRRLVRSAVEILLSIENSDQPTSSDPTVTTLENLKKIDDYLKSVNTLTQIDSTHVVESLVEQLSTMPQTDVSKVLDVLAPVLEDSGDVNTFDDATGIVSNGDLFIIKEQLQQQTDANGNVIDIVQSGTYKLLNPNTNGSWVGNFAVQDGTITTDPNGNIYVVSSGIYDVDLPQYNPSTSTVTRVKRQANFAITDNVVEEIDENGIPKVTDSGTYSLADPLKGTSKSGTFVVEGSVSKTNPDGSIEIIKAGIVYESDPTSPGLPSEPLLGPGTGYFLFDDDIFASPNSDGLFGSGIYNIKNPTSDGYQIGTYSIQNLTTVENPDGSTDSITSGVIYVDNVNSRVTPSNSDPILIVVNGAQFTFKDHVTNVTDINGNVNSMCTGEFTQTDPITQITTSGIYLVHIFIRNNNLDGSLEITKFGTFTDITFSIPSTNSSAPSSTTNSAKPLPIAKNSFDALVQSLNPVMPVQPETGITTGNTAVESTSQTTNYDVTSIVSNGATFIIAEDITQLLDPAGNVIGETIMGTYHIMDIQTNNSWMGAFDVEESLVAPISPGKSQLTLAGTFDVAPPADSDAESDIGSFLIKKQLSVNVDKSGVSRTGETGTYSLIDSITGNSKPGTFVVENIVSRSKPGGVTEVIRSGLLFVDETDTTSSSPSEQPLIPGYEDYFLFDDRLFDVPDSDGTYGTGVYSVKTSKTNEITSGTYVIKEKSTTNNADGTSDTKIGGVIYVDGFDPSSISGSSASPSRIINGSTFTLTNHLTHVTDPYGHVSLIGTGEYIRTDPETKQTQYEKYVLLNIVQTEDADGSTNVRKFGVFSIDSSSTIQPPTIGDQPKHLVLDPNVYEALVSSLNPIKPANSITSTSGNPIYDATAIATNGASFIINGHIVPQVDANGNTVAELETGTYSIRNSQTNTSFTGSFDVENFLITTATTGQIDVTSSGTYDVNPPANNSGDSTSSKNQANFSINDRISVINDQAGESTITENGSYSLTNSITGDSKSGDFVIENSISKVNPDGSIDIVKSGIMYVDEDPEVIKNGVYFLTDEHLLRVPDVNGNYGNGYCNFKNPQGNKYSSGTHIIKDKHVVNNADGTVDVTTSGIIYVDASQSSSTSTSSDPSLTIIDGAEFKFVDHISYVTDAYGHVNAVGTGVFNQTNRLTNVTRSAFYNIQDVVTSNNTDGTQDVIRSGIIYLSYNSNEGGILLGETSTNSANDCTSSSSDPRVSDLELSLQAIIRSMGALNIPTTSVQATSSQVTSTTTPAPTSVSLPRSNVASAINGECLSPGDVVAVRTNSRAFLLATIQDTYSPVTFVVTNFTDMSKTFATANKIWNIPENDFSKQDRSVLNTILNPVSSTSAT